MFRNILTCFIVAAALVSGLHKYDAHHSLQCWNLGEQDIGYWFSRAQSGDLAAVHQLLHAYANPESKHFNREEALFWSLILGNDNKHIYAFAAKEALEKDLGTEVIAEVRRKAADWKPNKVRFRGTNHKAIACGFNPEKISDQCGSLIGMDQGHALDGSYVFINSKTGVKRGECSFWSGKCVVPIEWTCECPKLASGRRLPCDKGYSDEERKILQKRRHISNKFFN